MQVSSIQFIAKAFIVSVLAIGLVQANPQEEALLRPFERNYAALFSSTMLNPHPTIRGFTWHEFADDKAEQHIIDELSVHLRAGANINYQGEVKSSRRSALMYAAYKGYPQVVRYLVKKRAKTNLIDKSGWNAYQFAEYYRDNYLQKYSTNEKEKITENFTKEDQASYRAYFAEAVVRYDKIACYLRPKTEHITIPRFLFSSYKGDTAPSCGWPETQSVLLALILTQLTINYEYGLKKIELLYLWLFKHLYPE